MNILPAIDLVQKKAVRLYKGDYNEMTVYSDKPLEVAKDFERLGASYIHIVDLEGAKDGTTPNIDVVRDIAENTKLFVEIGGGIRSIEVLEKYFSAGVGRAILGTAAVKNEDFLKKSIELYGDKIVVSGEKIEKTTFEFNTASAITVLGKNKLNVYSNGKVYQIKGDKRFCALKYVNLYHRYQNLTSEVENGCFLGL